MSQLSRARIAMFVFFVILIPLKSAILWIGGTETAGIVTSLGPACTNGPASGHRPSITVAYSVKGQDRKESVGNPDVADACGMHVGDEVKITYLDLFNDAVAAAGNPKELFFSWLKVGIIFNVVFNLSILIFKPWMRK